MAQSPSALRQGQRRAGIAGLLVAPLDLAARDRRQVAHRTGGDAVRSVGQVRGGDARQRLGARAGGEETMMPRQSQDIPSDAVAASSTAETAESAENSKVFSLRSPRSLRCLPARLAKRRNQSSRRPFCPGLGTGYRPSRPGGTGAGDSIVSLSTPAVRSTSWLSACSRVTIWPL